MMAHFYHFARRLQLILAQTDDNDAMLLLHSLFNYPDVFRHLVATAMYGFGVFDNIEFAIHRPDADFF